MLASLFLGLSTLVPPPQQELVLSPQAALPGRNLLGNGGFEVWNLGHQPQGPVPPSGWLPMGSAASLFTQGAVLLTRVDATTVACGSGAWSAEVTAVQPGNFLSQELESFAELRGRWVTFSADVTGKFGAAAPSLTVFDGVDSTTADGSVGAQECQRITVRHRVDDAATTLAFRIDPDQTIYVDNAQAIEGKGLGAPYYPRPNHEPGLVQVPLGTVLDWYRFDAAIPVPEGFAIADGSVVSDPSSPFLGLATVDLSDRFVRGTTAVGSIGTSGGNASVDLSHSHSGTTNDPNMGSGTPPAGFWWILQNPIGPTLLAANEDHRHPFGTSNALGSVSLEPPYVGLLKIVRIR